MSRIIDHLELKGNTYKKEGMGLVIEIPGHPLYIETTSFIKQNVYSIHDRLLHYSTGYVLTQHSGYFTWLFIM